MIDCLVFYCFFLLSGLSIKSKVLKYVVVITSSVLFMIDAISVFLWNHMDIYRFYEIGFDVVIYGFRMFPLGAMLCCLFMLFNIFLCYYISCKHSFRINKLILLFSCCCLCIFNKTLVSWIDIFRDVIIIETFELIYGNTDNCLKKLGIQKVLSTNEITTTPGKNLVLIYCESYESDFLKNDQLKHLSKDVNDLVQNGDLYFYDNYKMMPGAVNTCAAIYATQTGFPFYQDLSKAKTCRNKKISLTSCLNKGGYFSTLLASTKLKYRRVRDILDSLQYEIHGIEYFNSNSKMHEWGLNDRVLFDKAKDVYSKLVVTKKPFNLSLVTVDTHFPKGYPDSEMDKYIDPSTPRGTHEFTYACLSYHLADFIRFMKSQPNYENTVVVIIGDHLLMGDKKITPLVKKLGPLEDRRVMMLTNKKIKNFDFHDEIAFYDMQHIIFDLLEVETNVKMGKYLIPNYSKKFIEDNKYEFVFLARS